MSESIKIATRHKPRKLVDRARKYGDESFCALLDTTKEEFFKLLPDMATFGYEVSHGSAIMLSGGKNLQLFVRDNDELVITRMRPGDWVLFEDHNEHMVLADTKWTGIAVQVKRLTA